MRHTMLCHIPMLDMALLHGFSLQARTSPLSLPICALRETPKTSNIKVVVNGAGTELGRAAIAAVSKARGMEVAGAVDSIYVGQDAGEVAKLEEPLELPISNDLVMVLGSISQSKATAVMIDFSKPSAVYDNVRQATAFGMRSVVVVPELGMDLVSALTEFCDKASMGCILAPTLSIGAILLQEAAKTAAFHYKNVEIVESQQDLKVSPSAGALQLANSLSGLGQIYNDGSDSRDKPARGEVVGDCVRVHSMKLPGLISSLAIHFSAPGEILSLKHDLASIQALMPGLLLAIRRVVRLKGLVYGLEKIL
ncbi:hypothetical protein O6H91_11G116100 [Diphasiastrum complanatum]|uniref:Uncharacterized protein n=1 Tax=Diphasiastrum complanatum TaxID=34168 RepID=A0ACC2CE49_DIPCM|nr:hypothetical protein O6H91_11G116100 [Diphasiastrum complanatum]